MCCLWFAGSKSKLRVTAWLGFNENPLSGSYTVSPCCVPTCGRGKRAPQASSQGIHEGKKTTLMTFPKAPTS